MKFWNAIGGRKFLVLILGSAALYFSKLESWHWVIVAGLYLGVNVLEKFVSDKKE